MVARSTRLGVVGNTGRNAGRRVYFPARGSDGSGEGVGRSPDSPGGGPILQVGTMATSNGRWGKAGIVIWTHRLRPTPHGGGGSREEQPAGERDRSHWGYRFDGRHRRKRCFGPPSAST